MNSIRYKDQLKNTGHISCQFTLPTTWPQYTQNQDYDSLYAEISAELKEDSSLWQQINAWVRQIYSDQTLWSYEWMLALREGPQEAEQEGIWHDDSSRDLALSLSLNLNPLQITGGELRLRPRANREEVTTISARAWGEAHFFATGKLDWEHKTSLVSTGNRLVLVVWITLTA